MVSNYPACFYKEKDGKYTVVFPDLNKIATSGVDLKDAIDMAIDCLAGYIFGLNQDGTEIPAPSPLNKFDPKSEAEKDGFEYEEAFVSLICVDVQEYSAKHFNRAVRRTVTLPEWLEQRAKEKKINFSKTLQKALASELGLPLK